MIVVEPNQCVGSVCPIDPKRCGGTQVASNTEQTLWELGVVAPIECGVRIGTVLFEI